ncbi:Disease resistance protein [Melia azedarach]|uniref:Disease resistance protein n=1 Tax=Melia azedarach TaxID=155640 RepID=A0ACC1YDB4_MELAZ|nr:Disease resistance protein [Melia azedarach]
MRLESPANLYVSGTVIEELPSSVVCTKISFLDVRDCCITELPETLGQLFSLQVLCLDKKYFERIPESIVNLPELKRLSLRYCQRLQSLPDLPCNLQYIDAAHCTSLEVSSCLSTMKLTTLYKYIVESFHLSNCYKLDWEQRDYGINFIFPGSEIGEWFKHQSMGSSVTVKLRPHPNDYIDHKRSFSLRYKMNVKTEDGDWHFAWQDSVGTFGGLNLCIRHFVDSEHVVLGYHVFSRLLRMFSRKFGSIKEFSLQFYLRKDLDDQYVACCEGVRKCGINLVYAQELEESMAANSTDEEEEDEEE